MSILQFVFEGDSNYDPRWDDDHWADWNRRKRHHI